MHSADLRSRHPRTSNAPRGREERGDREREREIDRQTHREIERQTVLWLFYVNFFVMCLPPRYMKYCLCRLSCLPFVSHRKFPINMTHTIYTVGAYPRGTGSSPVEGMGAFFHHTVSSIFCLSLTRFVRLSGGPCRCLTSRSDR